MRWKLQAFEKSKSDKKADSKVRLSDGLQWSASVGLCPYFLHLSQTHCTGRSLTTVAAILMHPRQRAALNVLNMLDTGSLST